MKKCVIVDAYNVASVARYAYWGSPEIPDPNDYSLVCVFFNLITAYLDVFDPDFFVIAYDGKDYLRKKFFDKYKDGRNDPNKDIFRKQAWECLEISHRFFPISVFGKDGYEADDVIASYVEKYEDIFFEIVSSDNDLLQIVQKHSERARLYNPVRRDYVEFKYPDVDCVAYKALVGDRSDNIPSVTGEKTALKLLRGEICFGEWIRDGITRSEKKPKEEVFQRNLQLVDLVGPFRINSLIDEVFFKNNVKLKKENAINYLKEANLLPYMESDIDKIFNRWKKWLDFLEINKQDAPIDLEERARRYG